MNAPPADSKMPDSASPDPSMTAEDGAEAQTSTSDTAPRSRMTRDRKPPSAARIGRWLLIVVVVVALALAALYLNRRAAAKQILTGWLDQRGIKSDVEIEKLELNGFVGRVTIGDPSQPDVRIDRVEVDYALNMPWSRDGLGVTPSRVRLLRPIVHASWKNGELTLGSLDPLIKAFTGKPPRPDSRSPLVVVESGRLDLTTEYGPVQVLGDARLDDGKLMRLTARLPAASLKSGDIDVRGLGGSLDVTTTGDRIAAKLDFAAAKLTSPAASGETLSLSGTANLPYPDMKTAQTTTSRWGDGRAVVDLTLTGNALSSGATSASQPKAHIALDGVISGWIEVFSLKGAVSSEVSANSLSGPGLKAGQTSASLSKAQFSLDRAALAPDSRTANPSTPPAHIRWSLEGPTAVRLASLTAGGLKLANASLTTGKLDAGGRGSAFEVSGPMALTADRFGFGDLSLTRVNSTVALDVVQDGVVRIEAEGALASRGGAWPLFGPIASDDVPELAEMKRALGAFAVSAPAVKLTTGSSGTEIRLQRPATLTPANGGVLTVSPTRTPIFAAAPGQNGGGALSLQATRGKGLPELEMAIPNWSLTRGGFQAQLDGRAALDFGQARGLKVTTKGLLASDNGRLTYQSPDCLVFSADRLDMDGNDAVDLSGKLCPGDRPLIDVRNGAWRADGTFADLATKIPFLDMQVEQATGRLGVTGAASGLGLEAAVTSARVTDTAKEQRFNPLAASGSAALRKDRWTGGFDLVLAAPGHQSHPLAHITLDHNSLTGVGGMAFETPNLAFAKDALQPDDITPLIEDFVQSPVTGSADFTGRFDWSPSLPEGGQSSGRLIVPNIDFVSPAGPVTGLKGAIEFTSLVPLTTAPGQSLAIDRLDTVTALTDFGVTFMLDQAALNVAGGEIKAAGGVMRMGPLKVPLDMSQPFSGVLELDRVQLGELVKGAGFDDKVSLDAVVSGALPFSYDPVAGVKIAAGSLKAVQPGRLSIKREALVGVQAAGGPDVPPGTVEDLAYQAMQDLAFQTLSADVNSLEGGRVAILFHIKGRHDPPKRQELRLTVADLISRKFLERSLPLPSDTGIDLTLDTTVNLNQIISDLLEVNRARAGEANAAAAADPDPETPVPATAPSAPVSPPAAKLGADTGSPKP